MTILINFKICDNVPDCNGIRHCPFGAFYFDEETQSIKIDHDKCNNCGKCVKSCFVGAIRLAKTKEQEIQIQKEIDEDPRTVKDLFVDRYGGAPISTIFSIKETELEKTIFKATKIAALEVYNDNSIECLVKSIPIKELFDKDVIYRKMAVDENFMTKYNITTLPSLLFWKEGKLIGKIEGFFDNYQKDELKKQINFII